MRSIRPLPPRGTMTSTCFSSAIRWPTAARSVVAITCTASSGSPAARRPSCTQAAIAALLWIASEPPRRIVALPDLRHRPGGVGGHVGARFVDDADHAERHAHPADLDAGGPVLEVGDLADRVGQRRDLLEALRHRLDRGVLERQPVDERGVLPLGARGLDVLRVGREEPRRVATDGGGHGHQRAVLRGGVGPGEVRATRRARPRPRAACTQRRRRRASARRPGRSSRHSSGL